jgi:hypothetical protein
MYIPNVCTFIQEMFDKTVPKSVGTKIFPVIASKMDTIYEWLKASLSMCPDYWTQGKRRWIAIEWLVLTQHK